jgi:hypothetical protein
MRDQKIISETRAQVDEEARKITLRTLEALDDVTAYGWEVFTSVDRSIALHGRLKVTEPWNLWHEIRHAIAYEIAMGEKT